MATKKIRWTSELLSKQSFNTLKNLPTAELVRAVNKFYSGLNRRLDTMEKMNNEGYYVPSLYDKQGNKKTKGSLEFKSADFLFTKNQLINELLRMKQFNELKSTSAKGIEDIYRENRKKIRELYQNAGYSYKEINTIMGKLKPQDITNIWKAYRKSQEDTHVWGSQQRLLDVVSLYEKNLTKYSGKKLNTDEFIDELFGRGIYEKSDEEIKAEIEKLKAEQEPLDIMSLFF